MAIELVAVLWARPGQAEALGAYEDAVLSLVPDHGGRVVQRARGDGADGDPDEVQLFSFPSEEALAAYLADPRRTALGEERDRAIARTELHRMRFS